jgi:hypothetical protein
MDVELSKPVSVTSVSVTPVPVTVLLMATDMKHMGLRNAIDSLARHGYVATAQNATADGATPDAAAVLGGGSRRRIMGEGEKWGGWRHRMQSYRDGAAQAAKEHPKALVVCMDAYDALSVRAASDGLVKTFESFGKPLVLGMERFCGGNCLTLRDWWRTHGKKYATIDGDVPIDRYVNGGLLMGTAEAVRDVYDWMLKNGATDDQIGLANYALKHRDQWAPDCRGKIFKNRIFGAQLTKADLTGRGCYFAHFPGMRHWNISAYDRAVEKILERKSGLESYNLGSPTIYATSIIAIVLVSVAIVIVAWYITPNRFKPKPLQTLTSRFLNSIKQLSPI